jgi:hypothetical protein
MKGLLISLFLILLIGCTSQAPKPLTDLEKEKIINEVKKDFYTMVEACNKVDLQTALKYYLDSPDFIGLGVDGMLIDFATFKKMNEDFFNAAKSVQFPSIKEVFKVLAEDKVLLIWQYKAEAILKTDEKISFDKVGLTFLFEKIEGAWKIVYYHESALPPVMTKL